MAQAIPIFDKAYSQGTAAASGGQFTMTYAIPTDKLVYIRAICGVTFPSGGHLSTDAGLVAEGWFSNKNGTVTISTALASSLNTANSNSATFADAHAEASDYGASGVVALGFDVSGLSARCIYTNIGNPNIVNVTIVLEVTIFGST